MAQCTFAFFRVAYPGYGVVSSDINFNILKTRPWAVEGQSPLTGVKRSRRKTLEHMYRTYHVCHASIIPRPVCVDVDN